MIRASSTTPGPSTISTQSWVEDFETLASNSGKGASVYKECLAECRQPDGSVLYTEALCTVEDQLRLQIKSLSGISTAISELAAQQFTSDGDICESNLPQEDRERVDACGATLKEDLTALQSLTATEEIGSEVTAIPRRARTDSKRSKTASSARSLQQKIVDRRLTALASASDPGKET